MAIMSAATRSAQSRRAVLIRHHGPDHPQVTQADTAYQLALLEDRIRGLLADAPPIPAEVRSRIALLLLTSTADGES